MNYINVNNKRLVTIGSNNQQLASPLVLDYSTITELQFQFVNDQNQTQPIDSEKVGLYFAGSLGIGKEAFELLFLSKEYTIENNTITFTLDTYTVNYLNYIKKKNTEINIEIGENFFNQKKVYLRDMAYACPRVYVTGLTPMEIASDDYYTKEEVDALLSGGGGGISGQVQADWAVDNPMLVSFIKNKPTEVSVFNNDAGYITGYTEIDPVFTSTSGIFELKSEAFDGDYNNLTNKPTIPTKVSDLTNDEGYITGYTEIDPVFVAQSGLFELKSEAFDGDYNNLTNKPLIPTKVSDLTNDEGYITGFTESDPIFASQSGLFELKSEAFDGNYNNLTNAPTDVSHFTNDAGYITGYTETDPVFTSVSSSFVQLDANGKIPTNLYGTNQQKIFNDTTPSGGTAFALNYQKGYDIFINTLSLSNNNFGLEQITFTDDTLNADQAATLEHWIKFENQDDADTVSINSNIVVVGDMPDSLTGTLIHVFVRRVYKDSNNTVHEAISYSHSF